MVMLDSQKLMECMQVEKITKDSVTLNIDGEKLREEIYQDLKVVTTYDYEDLPAIYFQDAPLIKFYPNELYTEEFIEKIAIEICNRLNNELKSKLGIIN